MTRYFLNRRAIMGALSLSLLMVGLLGSPAAATNDVGTFSAYAFYGNRFSSSSGTPDCTDSYTVWNDVGSGLTLYERTEPIYYKALGSAMGATGLANFALCGQLLPAQPSALGGSSPMCYSHSSANGVGWVKFNSGGKWGKALQLHDVTWDTGAGGLYVVRATTHEAGAGATGEFLALMHTFSNVVACSSHGNPVDDWQGVFSLREPSA